MPGYLNHMYTLSGNVSIFANIYYCIPHFPLCIFMIIPIFSIWSQIIPLPTDEGALCPICLPYGKQIGHSAPKICSETLLLNVLMFIKNSLAWVLLVVENFVCNWLEFSNFSIILPDFVKL